VGDVENYIDFKPSSHFRKGN